MVSSEDSAKAMEVQKLFYELSRKYDNDELIAQIIADCISKAANNTGDQGVLANVAKHLSNEHRTLQQNVMRGLIYPFLKLKAEDALRCNYDLRNEATCEASKLMIEATKEKEYFPFV